jgi:outer membrane protein insertion porin family
LGGTIYWGVTAELQYPLFFAPKDFGMRAAVFADAGSLYGYKGITNYIGPHDCRDPVVCGALANGQTITPSDSKAIRSSVGVGLIWDSPFGPLRFDYAIALTKDDFTVLNPVTGVNEKAGDRTQAFRFSGGTKF